MKFYSVKITNSKKSLPIELLNCKNETNQKEAIKIYNNVLGYHVSFSCNGEILKSKGL